MSTKATAENVLRLFGMSTLMLESGLRQIEVEHDVDLGHTARVTPDRDDVYYPQFDERIRREAAVMGQHYEIFYCLEKTIRELIVERLIEDRGPQWWDTAVPQHVRDNASRSMQRDIDSGFTVRSSEPIDYTTFGELGEIIKQNWPTFEDTFNSRRAVEKVMANLNLLRGPIAHCSALAPDEVSRLQLTVRDWFRLME